MSVTPSSPNTFPDLHPLAERPLSINWVDDLETGEAIASQSFSYTGPDTNLVLDRVSKSISVPTITSAWAKLGTLGAQYKITATVVTDSDPPKTLKSVKLLNIRDDPR